jgi:hypothetical protein
MIFVPSRVRRLALAVVASAVAVLMLSETASAAALCRPQQVIADWSDNGRVDRIYPLDCYQQAVEALAPDIRDYTDAQESIELALTTAVRKQSGTKPALTRSIAAATPVETDGSASLPLPLVALGALGAAGVAAGAVALAFRRPAPGRKGPRR